MKPLVEIVQEFFETAIAEPITNTEIIPLSGGDRRYFRFYTAAKSYIGCYNENIKENETFFYYTRHFKAIDVPLPEILAIDTERKIYILEDLGKESLLNNLEAKGFTTEVFDLYKKSLRELARMQILGAKDLNFDVALTAKEFGKQAIMSDLLYFKYYFVDTLKIPYDKQQLLEDFRRFGHLPDQNRV